MSNNWTAIPLGEILTKSEEWISIEPDKLYKEVTVRLWGKGVVQRREVSGAEISAGRRLVVRPQQFIMSRIDARNGAFGLIPDSLDGAIVSNDFPTFALDTSKILSSFLSWMSKTQQFVDLCRAASEGTTNRVRLKEDRFLAAKVLLPSIEEQQRIVGCINELAAKIDDARHLRNQASYEANTLTTSLMRQLINANREVSVWTAPLE